MRRGLLRQYRWSLVVSRIRNWKDLQFGSSLIGVGLLGLLAASGLPAGSLLRMGPGWVPDALCVLLGLLGAALVANGFLRDKAPPEGIAIRPMIFVFSSVAFFALFIDVLGLPLSVFGTILLASAADYETRLLEAVGAALLLAVVCTLIFVGGLGMAIAVLPLGF